MIVTIAAGRPNRRRRDADNLPKAILDLLTLHQVIEDDSQVTKVTTGWDSAVPAGVVHVTPMFTATPRTSLPRSPSMTCDFVTVDADGQAQPIQIKFSILADPPVFGTRNHNWRNRSQALNNLLRFVEASQMGQA